MEEQISNTPPLIDDAQYTEELLQKGEQEDLTRSMAGQRKAQADIDVWASLLTQHADKTTDRTLLNIFSGLLKSIKKKRMWDREVESYSLNITSCVGLENLTTTPVRKPAPVVQAENGGGNQQRRYSFLLHRIKTRTRQTDLLTRTLRIMSQTHCIMIPQKQSTPPPLRLCLRLRPPRPRIRMKNSYRTPLPTKCLAADNVKARQRVEPQASAKKSRYTPTFNSTGVLS